MEGPMTETTYHYVFEPGVPQDEVEDTLVLAVLAVEALHGESQTRLDADHAVEWVTRSILIDAATTVGKDLNRLFTGLVVREFGAASFRVHRVPTPLPA